MPSPVITRIQKQYIHDIENVLKVKYNGSTLRRDATAFIEKYKEQHKKRKKELGLPFSPTGKQCRFIKDIEDALGVIFDGNTMEDASKFIDEYYYDYIGSDKGEMKSLQRTIFKRTENYGSFHKYKKGKN